MQISTHFIQYFMNLNLILSPLRLPEKIGKLWIIPGHGQGMNSSNIFQGVVLLIVGQKLSRELQKIVFFLITEAEGQLRSE